MPKKIDSTKKSRWLDDPFVEVDGNGKIIQDPVGVKLTKSQRTRMERRIATGEANPGFRSSAGNPRN